MKDITLIININRSVPEILDFVLNPKNTPLWIESFVKEETNEWPPKIGTIYTNVNTKGETGQVKLIDMHDHGFEMATLDGAYHVRYTLTPLSSNKTEFEYYEWMVTGELESPFEISVLEKLKSVLES